MDNIAELLDYTGVARRFCHHILLSRRLRSVTLRAVFSERFALFKLRCYFKAENNQSQEIFLK